MRTRKGNHQTGQISALEPVRAKRVVHLAKRDVAGDRQDENTPLGNDKWQPHIVIEAMHNDHLQPPKARSIPTRVL